MKKYLVSLMMITIFAALFSACLMDAGLEEGDIEYVSYSNYMSVRKNSIFKNTVQIEKYIDQEKAYFYDCYPNASTEEKQERWEEWARPRFYSMLNKYNNDFFDYFNLIKVHINDNCKVNRIGIKNNTFFIEGYRKVRFGPQPGLASWPICLFIAVRKTSFNGDIVEVDFRDIYTLW